MAKNSSLLSEERLLKDFKILQTVRRSPNMPYRDIALQFSVTREYVRNIAQQNGIFRKRGRITGVSPKSLAVTNGN